MYFIYINRFIYVPHCTYVQRLRLTIECGVEGEEYPEGVQSFRLCASKRKVAAKTAQYVERKRDRVEDKGGGRAKGGDGRQEMEGGAKKGGGTWKFVRGGCRLVLLLQLCTNNFGPFPC